MKIQFHYMAMLVLMTMSAACKYDNYAPPSSTLKGKIVYNGEPINVSYNDVVFELWEPGWQKNIPINVTVAQDGSYSALLFNATYKLVIPKSQGPFMSKTNAETKSDTIIVNLKGSQNMNIEVLPYYMVRNPQFSAVGNKLSASCKLEQIITGTNARSIERVSLYISKTNFVDSRTSISTKDLNGRDITDFNNISLSVNIPSIIPAQNYVFARIGVKISGVEDMLFSPVQKIQL